MAGRFFLIIFICLIIIPGTTSYNILHRLSSKFDQQRLLFNRTLVHSTSNFNDCIPVQAIKHLNCPFIEKNNLNNELFESICQQHQLCYACGSVQGITEQKCNRLSLIHMYELCSKNSSSEFDCLKNQFSTLILLRENVYRSSDFSFECYDKCVLNYLYSK